MKEADASEEARRWLWYSAEDLLAAESMVGQARFASRHACWLAQQAAEKALKAALVFLQIDFPWVHDLDALRNLLPEGWRTKREHPDLAELTDWAVEARYPRNVPDATTHDAQAATRQSRALCESVLTDLHERGVTLPLGADGESGGPR